jgi:hypothetical protein
MSNEKPSSLPEPGLQASGDLRKSLIESIIPESECDCHKMSYFGTRHKIQDFLGSRRGPLWSRERTETSGMVGQLLQTLEAVSVTQAAWT